MSDLNNKDDKIDPNYFESLPDYISMKTKVWGPATWFFLHSMSMAYPKKINKNNAHHMRIRNSMYAFLSNLGNILPCPLCGESYNKYIKEPELSIEKYIDTRENLVYFIFLIHEKVNDKLGVPACDRLTFKEAVTYYSQFIATGEIPCTATTEEERAKKRLKGCSDNVKNFQTVVNVFENLDSYVKGENTRSIKETFSPQYNWIKDVIYIIIIFALASYIFIKYYN